jgi:hypothetical protein
MEVSPYQRRSPFTRIEMRAFRVAFLQRNPLFLLIVLIICLRTESFKGYTGKVSRATDSPRGYNSDAYGKSSEGFKLTATDKNDADFFTFKDIEDYAKISGLTLNCTTTGPFLRIEAFPTGEVELIGYLTAFIRPLPFGLFHLDTIKVKNRRQNLGYVRKNWTIDGPGISFIMGSYALLWAYERGCRKSQLLAVNDEALMHAILTRLYQR